MKRFLKSEIGAAVVWVILSILLAALVAPCLYQGGKWLAGRASAENLPDLLEWLGAACGRSGFSRFFDRSLLLGALFLMPFLIRRLRRIGRQRDHEERVNLVKLPLRNIGWHVVLGFLIAGGILWALALGLDAAGAYQLKASTPDLGKVLRKVALPSVIASLLEEWLFRGVLLGLWLRLARPSYAVIGTSLLFAFVHFLKPPDGMEIADPSAVFAGFDLLGKILLHFTDPLFFVTDFATLFAVGLILAYARVRTGALWFSIGLHAGWIFAFKLFNLVYRKSPDHPVFPWGVGESLRSGLLPLLALLLTAWVCHLTLRRPILNRNVETTG